MYPLQSVLSLPVQHSDVWKDWTMQKRPDPKHKRGLEIYEFLAITIVFIMLIVVTTVPEKIDCFGKTDTAYAACLLDPLSIIEQ
jgi:hypothetical protein